MHPQTFFQARIKEAFANEEWLSHPVELYQPIHYTLNRGGKRIRPLLVLLANDLFGGHFEKAIKPAMGIEIFHNFTLLHDDIMDLASLRRGKETVYKKWGVNRAILSGDTMFAMAYSYISQVEKDLLPEVLELFTTTAREVCEGQQYDMNFESLTEVTMENYLQMIRMKTAVLLACSLKLGALLAHASKTEAEKMYSFGENLGMAFQIQDDLLDAFGDVEKFGKQIGGDIASGKKTFLVIKALEFADRDDKSLLIHLLNDTQMKHPDKVARVKDIYMKLNIQGTTLKEIENYFSLALTQLKNVEVADADKNELAKLAHTLLQRQH